MRQSCTVRACAFNAGAAQQPECLSPTEQLFVPFVMGAHRQGAQSTASCVYDDTYVNVKMGVNAQNYFCAAFLVFHAISLC